MGMVMGKIKALYKQSYILNIKINGQWKHAIDILFWNIAAKWFEKNVPSFTTHESHPSCNKSGCYKLCEYWLLIGKN